MIMKLAGWGTICSVPPGKDWRICQKRQTGKATPALGR